MLKKHGDDIRLLFTDVQMPDERDGFDLARETSQSWPHVKILVASGAAKPNDCDLPDGAVFVAKPFSAAIIHARLQELLPDGEKPEPLRRERGG